MTSQLAFLFPGQGSQSVGMLAQLAEQYPQVQQTFEVGSAALGYDLWRLVNTGPSEKLNQTQYTQPAMLAAGVAVWRVWHIEKGAMPEFVAGHSLGEYTALVCAGALEFQTAIKLVAKRGELMQQAVPAGVGAMAAIIGLDDNEVEALCEQSVQGDEVLSPANYNAHGQVVIAGHAKAVERAIEAAKPSGAKLAKLLPVSVPSHCELMKPAAQEFAMYLEQIDIQPPKLPVISNVDVSIDENPAEIRDALIRQLYKPVRWVEIITMLASKEITKMIECGPGKVLTGLSKRIVRDIPTLPVYDVETLQQAL